MNPKLVLATLCIGAPCWAQPAPAAKPPLLAATTQPARDGEPAVKRMVIEDEGARIEELRVRGEAQRIVVTPKFGIRKSYEIITGDAARDAFDGTGGTRSSAGKRVWNVLQF